MSFDVPVDPEGVTFEEDGAPPSGPSSFAVLDDGSVVIADTHAVQAGDPRLLRYDRTGTPLATIRLAEYEVAAIVDVVTDGSRIAILDVFVAQNRYRVLLLDVDGTVELENSVPQGFHFEDGLTGLAWDDHGILLEFEFGAHYARLLPNGEVEAQAIPSFNGSSVVVTPGEGRATTVVVGALEFDLTRPTELGGVTLVGLADDGSTVLVVDEVDTTGSAIHVTQWVRRYDGKGEMVAEYSIDVDDQFVEILRPWELAADGEILYLAANPDGVRVIGEAELADRD